MGEPSLVTTSLEEEERRLITALEQIVISLEVKKNFGDESRKIFADLGTRLINISGSADSRAIEVNEEDDDDDERFHEIEHQLNIILAKISSFEEKSVVWGSASHEAYDYLNDIEEAHRLMKTLESRDYEDYTLLDLADDVLQIGMARLEDEFWSLLVQKPQTFEPEEPSFRSTEEDLIDGGSIVSSQDDTLEYVEGRRDSTDGSSEEYVTELVDPDVIPFLRMIANLMFGSNYGCECSNVYTSVRRDALDECLCDLGMEKLSIEDVLKMEWEDLDSVIMKWIWAIKHFVQVQLVSEKSLAYQIFGDIESVCNACFFESSKTSILAFLNFCESICISPCRPEKLIRVLMMYEALAYLIPQIDSLYSFDSGLFITTKCRYVLGILGDYSRSIFLEFFKAIASSSSENVKAGGGVHALTSYVMNYLKVLTDSRKTFDEVMKDLETRNHLKTEDHVDEESNITPTEKHFRSIITILECNLEEIISKLYRDEALRHIFLMNNIHYIAEKMKGPELVTILGDECIRKRIQKVHHQEMEYEKATWNSILAFLRDDGINYPLSNSASRTILNERLRSFNFAFEEVYRNQTGWTIPDTRLRDDVIISISLRVIPAYRSFLGRFGLLISEKHIKYSLDDLEEFLLDLLQDHIDLCMEEARDDD